MHKYLSSVIVSKFVSKKKSEVVHVQEFPQASFFAVTAYQNDQVSVEAWLCLVLHILYTMYLRW